MTLGHLVRGGSVAVVVLLALLDLGGCGDQGAGTRVDPAGSTVAVPSESDPVRADIDPCPRPGPSSAAADPLPDVELACLGPGEPVTMAELSGTPLVVNVWASWCRPCRDEMPWLQKLADTGSVAVLGVDAEDQSGAASALLTELGVTYPSVFDPGNSFAREVGVVSKPMSVLVSDNGEVVAVVPGAFESYRHLVDEVESELDVKVG